jgi:acyl-CoA dehydrogenase
MTVAGTLSGPVPSAGPRGDIPVSTALIWAMHCQQAATIAGHAAPALKQRLLPRICAGEVYLASVTFRDLRSASLNYANERLLSANGALTLLDRNARLG